MSNTIGFNDPIIRAGRELDILFDRLIGVKISFDDGGDEYQRAVLEYYELLNWIVRCNRDGIDYMNDEVDNRIFNIARRYNIDYNDLYDKLMVIAKIITNT